MRGVRTFAQDIGRQCQRRSSPLSRAGDLNREWFAVWLGRRAGTDIVHGMTLFNRHTVDKEPGSESFASAALDGLGVVVLLAVIVGAMLMFVRLAILSHFKVRVARYEAEQGRTRHLKVLARLVDVEQGIRGFIGPDGGELGQVGTDSRFVSTDGRESALDTFGDGGDLRAGGVVHVFPVQRVVRHGGVWRPQRCSFAPLICTTSVTAAVLSDRK